jgi:hypothetical protein
MINQYISNYSLIISFVDSKLKPNGDSASPKEIIFHITHWLWGWQSWQNGEIKPRHSSLAY